MTRPMRRPIQHIAKAYRGVGLFASWCGLILTADREAEPEDYRTLNICRSCEREYQEAIDRMAPPDPPEREAI